MNLIPSADISFYIVYELIEASYFKAGAKRAAKDKEGFTKKIAKLNKEYFSLIGHSNIDDQGYKRAEVISTQIRELINMKY